MTVELEEAPIDNVGELDRVPIFKLPTWGYFRAHIEGRLVGGAAIAFDDDSLMLLGPARRRRAVGHSHRSGLAREGSWHTLFRAAEQWAIGRRCEEMSIETQNINVPACRFYLKQGCTLCSVTASAYPSHPDEVQLVWVTRLR